VLEVLLLNTIELIFKEQRVTRLIFCGKHDYIVSAGFGRNNQRQYEIYDIRNFGTPVITPQKLDNASGIIMPFYDMDTELLFLAGKGDGNIRYYEVDFEAEVPVVNYVLDFSSNVPTAGMGYMPKRGCNVSVNEVARLFKVTENTVSPLSFRVPRKSPAFADDIFCPCSSDEPALTTDAWLGGDNATPRTVSLEHGFVERAHSTTSFVKQEVEEEPSGAALLEAFRRQKRQIETLEARVRELEGSS